MAGSLTPPPHRFVCPLTLELFQDPVLSKYGHIFERCAILEWLEDHGDCPMTRQPLSPRFLLTHTSLRREIQEWRKNTLKNSENQSLVEETPPDDFICPLTGRVFDHPVVTKHGLHYERSALLPLLRRGRDPMTGEPLSPSSVITDRALLARIQVWKQLTGRATGSEQTRGDSKDVSGNKEHYRGKEGSTVKEDAMLQASRSIKSVTRNTPAA